MLPHRSKTVIVLYSLIIKRTVFSKLHFTPTIFQHLTVRQEAHLSQRYRATLSIICKLIYNGESTQNIQNGLVMRTTAATACADLGIFMSYNLHVHYSTFSEQNYNFCSVFSFIPPVFRHTTSTSSLQ